MCGRFVYFSQALSQHCFPLMTLLSSTKSTKVHLLELEALKALGTPNQLRANKRPGSVPDEREHGQSNPSANHLLRCSLWRELVECQLRYKLFLIFVFVVVYLPRRILLIPSPWSLCRWSEQECRGGVHRTCKGLASRSRLGSPGDLKSLVLSF